VKVRGRLYTRVCVLLLLVSAMQSVSASVADSIQTPLSNQQSAIRLIDYEILLLRTEIALRNSDQASFRQFMQQLQSQSTPPQFVERVTALQQQLILMTENTSELALVHFDQAAKAEIIVILLPLSGDYAQAGQALLKPIQQALVNKKTYVIDTSLYDDMFELWGLVKLFQPELIVGPLERHKAESFLAIAEPIPTFLFTSVETDAPHLRSLASPSLANAAKLVDAFSALDLKQVAWITDHSRRAEEVVESVVDQYAVDNQDVYTPKVEKLTGGLDKSLARLLGVEQSQARKNWLQRTLGRDLEYVAHVREDKKMIAALMSAQYAMQLKPLLDYYARPLPVIWVPTEVPDAKNFNATLAFWQQTYALLPAHFVQKIDGKTKKNTEEFEVGLFYALAEITIEMLRHADRPLPYEFQSAIGRVEVQADGKYYIFPELYELNEGHVRLIRAEQVMQKIQ